MTSLGIDIGCISLKAALAGEADDHALYTDLLTRNPDLFQTPHEGLTVVDGRPVLVARYTRIKGSPGAATQALLDALHSETRTIFEMGGETSKFIRLETGDEARCAGIVDYQTNGDCAAGTGSFMDQQASRLLYDIEDVGDIVLDAGKAASIAGRCSVFAKSDMIHAQQKGYEPPEVLRGLCDAVMRNFKGTIAKGKVVQPPIAFIGGVAANRGAVQALQEAFDLEQGDLFVPEFHASLGAVGAALIEADFEDARVAMGALDASRLPAADFPVTEPLCMDKVVLLRDMAQPFDFCANGGVVDAYMGIDIGSVSTNLVVVDNEGRVIKEIYTKTDARPVEVVTKGLIDIHDEIGARINLLGVGTTGSGRELIGELCGADIITDEITAHKTGADFISRKIGRQVDTIFEIGGQDSKFISLQDGIVVDFAMNEACAAGTGSFLEEQAEKLGINIIDEFAQLALSSAAPIRLGERCTVFMERDVMAYQQRGARREDLVGGLAFSIATNYLNRLVRERTIGDCVFFQGGTAYNDAVAAAFSQILDTEIIVPPYNGVIGALGMALLARERTQRTGEPSSFRGRQRARRRLGAHGRPRAEHVHLRPAALLGDVLRRARPASGAVAGERQADPRGRGRPHGGRAVLPHPRRSRARAVAAAPGRRLGVPAQPGQRRDRVHFVQLAHLPLGPDSAVRGPYRPRPGRAPRQDPAAPRDVPRRARKPGARHGRHGRAAGREQGAAARRARPRLRRPGRVPRGAARRRPGGAGSAAEGRRARHRPRRPPVQHVRQGHQHGHPAQAAQVLRGECDPARLPAHQWHRHRSRGAQHVLELRAQDPADGDLRARPRAPASHLPDQLQMRAGLVHQALRARGLGQTVPYAAVRRAPERRRGHDPLRGLPRQ